MGRMGPVGGSSLPTSGIPLEAQPVPLWWSLEMGSVQGRPGLVFLFSTHPARQAWHPGPWAWHLSLLQARTFPYDPGWGVLLRTTGWEQGEVWAGRGG